MEHKVKDIRHVAIAKRAARPDTFILGTVGGFRSLRRGIAFVHHSVSRENQIDTLVEEGVDGLLFETYYDLEELTNIVTTTRRKYDIPIIAQLTASNTNYLVDGTEINKALQN